MRQIVLVEEAYAKKFNLPDALWSRRFAEPKVPRSYYHVRAVHAPDGRCLTRTLEWPALLANYDIMNNPRLMADISRGHTFLAVDPQARDARGQEVADVVARARRKPALVEVRAAGPVDLDAVPLLAPDD